MSGTPSILPYSTADAYSSAMNMSSLLLTALLNDPCENMHPADAGSHSRLLSVKSARAKEHKEEMTGEQSLRGEKQGHHPGWKALQTGSPETPKRHCVNKDFKSLPHDRDDTPSSLASFCDS